MTNTSPLVFANRSAETALGTNPISVVANSKDDGFALDMATSTVAIGKIELAQRKGQQIPEQWGADGEGKPTTVPEKVLKNGGALLPLGGGEETGGYKGTGLGMFVELFCGVLGGAAYGKNVRKWGNVTREADLGQCFVAIDPECFAPNFADRLGSFLAETRGLKPSDADWPILVPGDKARSSVEKSEKLNGVIYGESQIKHLEQLATRCGVKPFSYRKLDS
jgi:LDH2 family malate/lactate/ureidoglycolate dehydrogenase